MNIAFLRPHRVKKTFLFGGVNSVTDTKLLGPHFYVCMFFPFSQSLSEKLRMC